MPNNSKDHKQNHSMHNANEGPSASSASSGMPAVSSTKQTFNLLNSIAQQANGRGIARYSMHFLSWRERSVLARISKTDMGAIAQQTFKDSNFKEQSLEYTLLAFARHPDVIGAIVQDSKSNSKHENDTCQEYRFPNAQSIATILAQGDANERLNQLVHVIKTPLEHYLRNILSFDINFSRDKQQPNQFIFTNLPVVAIAWIIQCPLLHLRFDKTIVDLANNVRASLHKLFYTLMRYISNPNLIKTDSKDTVDADAVLADGLEQLITRGVNINLNSKRDGWYCMATPLSCAFYNPRAVKILLKAGADPNQRSPDGRTPISHSRYMPECDDLKELIDAGLDVNAHIHKEEKITALMRASAGGYGYRDSGSIKVATCQLLLEAKAEVNAVDHRGRTALIMVVSNMGYRFLNDPDEYDMKVINMLLDAKADVNHADQTGNTALMEAAQKGYLKIVERLIQAGAQVNAQNKAGDNPLSLAIKKLNKEINLPWRRGISDDLVTDKCRQIIDVFIKNGAKQPPPKVAIQPSKSHCLVM